MSDDDDDHDDDDDDDDDDIETPEGLTLIYESIDTHFQPTVRGIAYDKDHAKLVSNGLNNIEDAIDGQPGDPGKLYPLHERVRRVVDVLQGKIGALESRGRR